MTIGDPRSWMWEEACATLERAERLHRQFFQPAPLPALAANWEPPVDILETEREIWIFAALPGVETKDLEVSVEPGVLVVAGARRLPATLRGARIHRLEIPHGRFERRIRLPAGPLELGRSELTSGCLVLSLTKLR
jgi:HSP20 family molecular chaperone IbpA